MTDDHFDLAFHLRQMRLSAGATFRQVLDLAQVMAALGFDTELPPWEVVVVEGVGGDGAALVIKLHHALVDGVGGVAVLMHLLDYVRHPTADHIQDPEPASDRTSAGLCKRLPTPARVVESMLRIAGNPAEQLQQIVASAASVARLLAPVGKPCSPLMIGRSFKRGFEVLDVAPHTLRQAATSTGGTLNDVFVAAVVRGLTLYHDRHGVSIDRLRALMPVNVRASDDPVGGNHFVPARFIVPTLADTRQCVGEVRRITASWKHTQGLAFSDALATGIDKLPDPVVTAMWGSMLRGDDFCITNVPGPPFETFLAGSRVERLYAFAPPSGAAVNISLVTMADRACVGIVVDTEAIPDGPQLAACMAEGFEEVLHLGDEQPTEGQRS